MVSNRVLVEVTIHEKATERATSLRISPKKHYSDKNISCNCYVRENISIRILTSQFIRIFENKKSNWDLKEFNFKSVVDLIYHRSVLLC